MLATVAQAIEVIKMDAYGYRREIPRYIRENQIDAIVGYHITRPTNVPGILAKGIVAMECQQGYTRPSAVYFFLDPDDIPANAPIILGNTDYATIIIHIPAKYAGEIRDDGLYNGTLSCSYSAAQFRDNIPAEWIKGVM